MTSTVLDVTVLLLCVSASVVALGGVGDDVGSRGPTADQTADRLVTETETVRYRASEAANGTRTVVATRAELLALLVADGGDSDDEGGGARDRGDADGRGFESRATDAIASGLDGRTRIDATVPTAGTREREAARVSADRRAPGLRGGRRVSRLGAVSNTPNAPGPSQRDGPSGDSRRSGADVPTATGDVRAVAVGDEPPRNADVTTAVVTHPIPSEAGTDGPVRIVVRRW